MLSQHGPITSGFFGNGITILAISVVSLVLNNEIYRFVVRQVIALKKSDF